MCREGWEFLPISHMYSRLDLRFVLALRRNNRHMLRNCRPWHRFRKLGHMHRASLVCQCRFGMYSKLDLRFVLALRRNNCHMLHNCRPWHRPHKYSHLHRASLVYQCSCWNLSNFQYQHQHHVATWLQLLMQNKCRNNSLPFITLSITLPYECTNSMNCFCRSSW